jgi:hypothetical protein
MKKTLVAVISVGFSILSASSIQFAFGSNSCNNLFPSTQSVPRALRADGDPAPPFPKPPRLPAVIRMNESVFVADGDPAPPFPRPPLGLESGLRHLALRETELASV